MKRFGVSLLCVLAAVGAAGASGASDPAGKCERNIQTCLDELAHELKTAGYLGAELGDGFPKKMVIVNIIDGSPAEKSGLKVGDRFLLVDDIDVSRVDSTVVMKFREIWKPGRKIRLTFQRGNKRKEVAFTLTHTPADVMARYIGTHMLLHVSNETSTP